MWCYGEHSGEHIGNKKTPKKNPRKREEEGTQEDDPFLGPRLKTIGFNLPTIGLTKYFQLWTQVPTKIHFIMGSNWLKKFLKDVRTQEGVLSGKLRCHAMQKSSM
jgi:hypothetical protein